MSYSAILLDDMMRKLECDGFIRSHAFMKRQRGGRSFKVNQLVREMPLGHFDMHQSIVKIKASVVVIGVNAIDLLPLTQHPAYSVEKLPFVFADRCR